MVFEHFCHDACVLPIETLPYWKAQFKAKAKMYERYKSRNNHLSNREQKKLIARIREEGPLCSKDFKTEKPKEKRAIWTKPAHKQTLDYLWLTGVLAVAKREKFTKYYDLAERSFPQHLVDQSVQKDDRFEWLVTHAINRLGFATATELKHFWDTTSLDETKQWIARNDSKFKSVSVESWDGSTSDALVLQANKSAFNTNLPLSRKMRIINPFDPIVRDRKRLERLFGFEYRIEIYVPANKRQYGYYVYPLLEYDKFVGRIEVRHDRTRNVICVDNLWNEHKVAFGKQRMQKLHSELDRLKRFCGAEAVEWS